MEYLIRDLAGGSQYVLQIRSLSGEDVSSWSPIYGLTAKSDTTIPKPPTSLNVTQDGSTFKVKWTKPTQNTNGKPLIDLQDYEITITAGSTSVIRYNVSTSFSYTIEMNSADFDTAQPVVSFSVKSRDFSGNLSAQTSTVTSTNAAPPIITGLVADGFPGSITVKWTKSTAKDVSRYRIHMDDTSGFTATDGNLVSETASTSVTVGVSDTDDHWFQVFAVDDFDQESPVAETAAAATGTGGGGGGGGGTAEDAYEQYMSDNVLPFFYWPLQGSPSSFPDASGNGISSEIYTDPNIITEDDSGLPSLGDAVFFGGVGSPVTLSTGVDDLFYDDDNPFSFAFWLKVMTTGAQDTRVVEIDSLLNFAYDTTGNTITVNDLDGNLLGAPLSASLPSLDEYHLITVQIDRGSGDNSLWINDTQVDTGTGSGTSGQNSSALTIGVLDSVTTDIDITQLFMVYDAGGAPGSYSIPDLYALGSDPDAEGSGGGGVSLPAGGTTGQVLKKASDDDGDVEWADDEVGSGVPTGGSTGQVLQKDSGSDGDYSWHTPDATQAELDAKQSLSEKGSASGYASLDGSTKVPIAQLPTGSSSSTVTIGNDSRLSDARTPTAHASTHSTGNSDPISPANIGAIPVATIDAKGDLLVGTADNTLARVAVGTNDFVLTADSSQTPGVKWAAPASGFASRTTAVITTGSLADLANEASTANVAAGYRIYYITVDRACRVRLYIDDSYAMSDLSRPIGTDPTGDHGLVLEAVFTGSGTLNLSPVVDGWVQDASDDVAYNIQNRSGSSHTVAVTLGYIRTE